METIKINGNNYQISFVDTEETIKNMVALREKTFRNHVRFTTFDLKNKNVQVELLGDLLKDLPEQDLLSSVDALGKEWGVPKNKIALEWLEIHHNGKIDTYDLPLAETFQKIDQTDFWGMNSVNTSYKTYKASKEKELKELAAIAKREDEFRKEYDKYTPVETTKFIQDSVIIEYQITINYDPLEAFDNIALNNTIPFVRLRTPNQVYYKVNERITPNPSWLEGEGTFTFRIARSGQKEEWGIATINYIGDTEPYDAIMTIETTVGGKGKGKKATDEESIRNALIGVFTNADVQIKSRKEKGIKGIFAVPEMAISRDVFLDLVTNEPMVSHYLYVDETRDLSSQKGVLYLYYSPGDDLEQVLTVFLSQRNVSRSDPFYMNKELLLFTPYLNVRVSRAMNLDQINRFQKAFAVILDVYRKKFDSIVKVYNELIPGFKNNNVLSKKRAIGEDKRLKALQAQDSELFIYGYPSKCEKKKQPVPIQNKDKKSWEKKRQIMNYPKGSMNFFVCPDDSFKYPGLIENKFANSDKYEYLPCCYAVNQKVGNKNWNRYMKDLDKVSRTKTANIVSKKAVGEDKLGYLPRNIHYILTKHAKKGEQFLRRGVAIGKNSFIAAVLLALDNNYITSKNKEAYVQDFRENLASQDVAAVAQQMYDMDETQIVRNILDPDVVFDSKLYVGLLEAVFDCNIVVFTRSEQQPNGEFEIPRYTQGYLYKKYSSAQTTVFIYKHMGARSDNLETSHYELILRYKGKSDKDWHFPYSELVRDVYSYFLRSYKLYLIGVGRFTATDIPPKLLADAKGQVVDRYGKTRGYTFTKDVFVAVSPIAPSGDIIRVDQPERQEWSVVNNFIKGHGLTVTAQDISDNEVIGVTVQIPGIPYAYIPIQPTKPLKGITHDHHLGFAVPTNDDILQQTLEHRKVADFLMQLLLYSFSLWYEEQMEYAENKELAAAYAKENTAVRQVKEKALINGFVEQFLKEKLVVEPGHDYAVQALPRRLTLNSSFFNNDDQLIADSEETQQRLGYYLRFMIGRNRTAVLNYSTRTYLENYYTYAADFKKQSKELVFIGGLSISNWIESQQHGISNQVHIVPHPEIVEPFFFSHWAINGGKPVIVQNVKNGNYNRALSVAAGYVQHGYNSGYNSSQIEELDHTEYYFDEGILKREGNSKVMVWKYAPKFYAAILVP